MTILPLLLLATQAQAPAESGPSKEPPYDLAWTNEEWTADEAPYLAIRKEVEAYTKGRRVSQTKTDLLERTQSVVTSAIANKRNPVTLYRAAYYEYMLAGLDYSEEAKKFLKANGIAMGNLPSPHSREYDRLRLLREGFLNMAFIDLGEKLYKFDPTDREVALKLVWTHARFRPGSRRRAVEISTRLLRTDDPKAYPAIYYAYGLAHHAIHSEEPTEEHAREAIWGYRKYLEAGPPWRRKAVEVDDSLKGFEKFLKDHGQTVPPNSKT